jgi:acyl dehydratase
MGTKRIIGGAAGLESAIGNELGVSDWLIVDQRMIDDFARTTGDEQWIHTDPARAASGPFGTTIAHGYLVLSLIAQLANQVYDVTGFSARVNYGIEKVRFPRPVRSGERVRDRVSIAEVAQTPAGSRVTFLHRIEVDNGDRPACVAHTLILFTP